MGIFRSSKPSQEDSRVAAALVELYEAYNQVQAKLAADEKGWSLLGRLEDPSGLNHQMRVQKAQEAELALAANR